MIVTKAEEGISTIDSSATKTLPSSVPPKETVAPKANNVSTSWIFLDDHMWKKENSTTSDEEKSKDDILESKAEEGILFKADFSSIVEFTESQTDYSTAADKTKNKDETIETKAEEGISNKLSKATKGTSTLMSLTVPEEAIAPKANINEKEVLIQGKVEEESVIHCNGNTSEDDDLNESEGQEASPVISDEENGEDDDQNEIEGQEASSVISDEENGEDDDLNDSEGQEESSVISDKENAEEDTSMENTEATSPIRLLEMAYEKVKDISNDGFHLVISQAIFFFQKRNCTIHEDAIDLIKNGSLGLSDIYSCNVQYQLQNLEKDFLITLGIAIYSFLATILVIGHALHMTEQGYSPIQGIYKCTDRIPIFDSLLEIPIALYLSPFVTIFLWSVFLACCAGLAILIASYREAEFENGNVSTFILTAFLVGFDLYRWTGNISQYYVINKTARADARKREEIDHHLSTRSLGARRREYSRPLEPIHTSSLDNV